MIGDSPDTDILGGLGAGLRTIWVSHGREWQHRNAAPHHTVPRVLDAFPLLRG